MAYIVEENVMSCLYFVFSFMEWAHKILLSVTDDFVDQFRSIGIVEALASIFKV